MREARRRTDEVYAIETDVLHGAPPARPTISETGG